MHSGVVCSDSADFVTINTKFIAAQFLKLHPSSKILLLPEIFLPTGVRESRSSSFRFLLCECTHGHVYSLGFFFFFFLLIFLQRLSQPTEAERQHLDLLWLTRSAAGLHMLKILKSCSARRPHSLTRGLFKVLNSAPQSYLENSELKVSEYKPTAGTNFNLKLFYPSCNLTLGGEVT